MELAFKPKRFLFIHCCANCEYGKKIDVRGTAKTYKCQMEERPPLPGIHLCDVDLGHSGEQLTWFDEIKEEK